MKQKCFVFSDARCLAFIHNPQFPQRKKKPFKKKPQL